VWDTFANCGVQHTQDVRAKEITLDQIRYASNAKCVAHPQMSAAEAEDDAVPEMHQLPMSLLGAVAYLARARGCAGICQRLAATHSCCES
jgi:hypothetical protein